MGNRTPLYDIHRSLNAKVINFGGWDMPLHYGSQIHEHNFVRESCGLFDVSHMTVVDVVGEGATSYLRCLLANDVIKLDAEQALYSCMLNDGGGILDDLIVYKRKNNYRLVLNCATREKDLNWMRAQKQAGGFRVDIVVRSDLSMLALQGPDSFDVVSAALPDSLAARAIALSPFYSCEGDNFHLARTGYTGEKGFELILPSERVADVWKTWIESGAKPVGLGARDTLRLEAGMLLYGTDMDEDVSPLECGLAWTVSLDSLDRTFIGREALVRQQQASVDQKLVGLVLPRRGVLRANMTVRFQNGGQGIVTSGTFSPTLGHSIGLARVPTNSQGQAEVEIRGKWLPVDIVKPLFVRFGKSLLQNS